jgi:hypothetical protein
MQIEVIYRDYQVELVEDAQLDDLIDSGNIIAFRRSNGLVLIGMDPVRKASAAYRGPERRSTPIPQARA